MIAPGTVLLHDNLAPNGRALLFTAPRETLIAHTADQARAALSRLEAAQSENLWAAGTLAYDLGFLFEDRLAHRLHERSKTPLLWFGLYDAPQHLTSNQATAWLTANTSTPATLTNLAPSLDFGTYEQAFTRAKALIAAGDTYQVNLTFKARFALEGDPVALYADLVRSQKTAHGALIFTGDHWVLSRSPELFVSLSGNTLAARPMKGTLKRGNTLAEDAAGRAALAADIKNRAENLMIVDLLRNDLGRIAEIGSVAVTDLFTVETYRSLHTMTSGIKARLRPGVSRTDILANLFPCGSITGAPKIRAMEIIDEIEAEARGLYTGAIGWFAPSGDLSLNVAIRTAIIDTDGNGEIGIGGGIVADSQARSEYDEALLKMKFLSDRSEPVALIETMLWTKKEGFYLLDRHLERLRSSCEFFGLEFSEISVRAMLTDWAATVNPSRTRTRLVLHEIDGLSLTATELPEPPENPPPFRFMISPERLDSASPWLYHKTTNRDFYDNPRQRAQAAHGVDEVIFLNENNDLTEGSITSIFIERQDILLTPPLSAGLLPGTLRAELLATGRAREQRLTLADLGAADAIYLGNSVRGLMRAEWIKPEESRG